MKRGGHEDGMICSVSAYIAYRIGTYTCTPYVYIWSQDVEKCALDLVLSSFTHTSTVQAIAVASKGCLFFLLEPLSQESHTTHIDRYGWQSMRDGDTPLGVVSQFSIRYGWLYARHVSTCTGE